MDGENRKTTDSAIKTFSWMMILAPEKCFPALVLLTCLSCFSCFLIMRTFPPVYILFRFPSRGKSHTCAKVANWYGLSLLHCSPLPLSPSSAQLKSSSAPDLKIIYVRRRGNWEVFCRRRPSGGHCQNGGCILLHFASRSFLFGSTPGRLVMEKFPSCKFCLAN